MKTYLKALIIIILLTFLNYFLIHKGNNRLSVWEHHGLWLPKSATNISYYTYPAFIIITDDWAKTTFEIPKSELYDLLKDEKYSYLISIDTSADKLTTTYHSSDYLPIPDSILNGPLP